MRVVKWSRALLVACAVSAGSTAAALHYPLCSEQDANENAYDAAGVLSHAVDCPAAGAAGRTMLADVDSYRKIRSELAMGTGTIKVARLCEIQAQIVAATARTEPPLNAEESQAMTALLLALGDNWEVRKYHSLAKASYLRSYQLLRVGKPNLNALTALQRLAQWESDHGTKACVLDMATAQERLARDLGREAGESTGVVVQAVEFKAELLKKHGDPEGAARANEEAQRLKEKDSCLGVCRGESR